MTAFTDLVGVQHPLQQAVMGGVSTPQLAGAVSRAGALGMLCQYADVPASDRISAALELAGGRPVGMGFFGHWVSRDLATLELAAARLGIVEVFWGDVDPALVERAHSAGARAVGWQVGSLDEALAAVDAGCDYVVAQGVEAGGHVRGTVPRAALLAQVLERVALPVVTAGGLATGAQVADALAEGAAAVRVGTRFVATDESDAHPAYVQALLAEEQTVLTTAYGVGWPDAPHRVLASAVAAAERLEGDVAGEHGGHPVPRFAVVTPGRGTAGRIDAMALYAGTGVGSVTAVQPAADVVADLVALLDRAPGRTVEP